MNGHFSREGIQMDNKKMLKIMNLLGNANQNHTEIPLYHPQDGYNFFFFKKEIAVLLGKWRSQNPHNCWGECKILKPLWKIVVGFQKAMHRVTIWLSNFNPMYLTWENWKTSVQIRICIGMNIAVLFMIAKMWEQPKFPSTDRWVDKVW